MVPEQLAGEGGRRSGPGMLPGDTELFRGGTPPGGHGFAFSSQKLGSAAWEDEPSPGQSSPVGDTCPGGSVPSLGRFWRMWLSHGCHRPDFTDGEVEAELGKATHQCVLVP